MLTRPAYAPAIRPRPPEFRVTRERQRAHLVGVCGSGMKALAEMLAGLGWTVTGSDLHPPSATIDQLRRKGFRIHRGHAEDFLPRNTDVLVYSPAITAENPERQCAEKWHIPQMPFNQMLGELMQSRVGVSVAGTHGKSTTTAMIASILRDGGFAPSAVIGGELVNAHANGWAGEGELFVVESCEYQRNFLSLCPTHAVLTGIEADHFDCFRDLHETRDAFAEFVCRLPAHGRLIIRGDCEASRVAAASSLAEIETYSLRDCSDWWAADLRPTDSGTRFRIFHHGEFFTEVSLQIPGRHNVLNAVGAAAMCHYLGASALAVREGLQDFRGIRRRFEVLGLWRGVTLIDDYAHHPTAVKATLQTAREQYPGRRLLVAFQAHQESRTRALLDEFAESFDAADEVFLAPIFTARENCGDAAEQTNAELAQKLTDRGRSVQRLSSLDRLVASLDDAARPGDVLVIMGAGDINQIQHELTRHLPRHHTT